MTDSTLLPCPFCGGDTPTFERIGTPRQSCIVVCGNCGRLQPAAASTPADPPLPLSRNGLPVLVHQALPGKAPPSMPTEPMPMNEDQLLVGSQAIAPALDDAFLVGGKWKPYGIAFVKSALALRDWQWRAFNAEQPAAASTPSDEQINEMAFQHGLVAEGYWSEDAIAFAREIEALAAATPQAPKEADS